VSFGVRLLQAGKSSDVAAVVEDEEEWDDAEEEEDDGEEGSWVDDDEDDEEWDEDDEETIATLDDDDDTSPRGSSDDDDDDDDFLFASNDEEETTATTSSPSLWFDDETSYVELMRSSSQHHPERLTELWTDIPKEKRTVLLYNAYLAASTAAATTAGGQSTMKPKQAEALLYGMIRDGLAPNVETIHHVMQCYVTSTVGLPALKIEQFLTLAQNSSRSNSNRKTVIDIPDSTYTLALQALSYHNTCPRKAQKAASLLSRLQQQPPSLEALRNAIRSCASIPVDSYPEDKMEAFRIGYEFYEAADQPIQMRLHGNILQLAANLLTPGSDKLNTIAQQIFAQAQTDGTANAFCIAQFRRAASSKVQLQVFGGDFDDLVRLPPSWSRNDGDNVPEVVPKKTKNAQ
jgi:hypothetical protein